MSSWWPSSGRYSPFTSFYSRSGPPRVTEDDYSYLAGDDHRSAQSIRQDSYGFPSTANNTTTAHHYDQHHRHGSSGSPRMNETADFEPDVLVLKHKGTTYPLHFPAFSISEGDLMVKDVRRQAAQQLNVDDPRRVKLLYKGKQMRDDKQTCKHENLKQNSEVMCVVSSETPRGDGSSDSEGSDSVAANGVDAGRSDDGKGGIKKRKGHRGGKKKRNPDGGRDSLAPPTDTAPTTSRTPSPAPLPTKKPTTPAEMIDSIQANFDSNLHPLVRSFLANPPVEQRARDLEYKKLSESILAQVLLKLDGVETMGDEVLRGRRKDMVKRVQGVLNELDAAGKR